MTGVPVPAITAATCAPVRSEGVAALPVLLPLIVPAAIVASLAFAHAQPVNPMICATVAQTRLPLARRAKIVDAGAG